jgi:hypothetical protein
MFEGCKLAAVVLILQQAGPPRGFPVSGDCDHHAFAE